MICIGIDPGPEYSAYVVTDEYEPMYCAKVENSNMRGLLVNGNIIDNHVARLVIEVPVCRKWSGQSICITAIWVGIFLSAWPRMAQAMVDMLTRQAVRMHTVGKKATDASIREYLIERFDKDSFERNKSGVYVDKGSTYFAGFHDDIWQAYALVVTFLDRINGNGGK
jgi:hypothetical protein